MKDGEPNFNTACCNPYTKHKEAEAAWRDSKNKTLFEALDMTVCEKYKAEHVIIPLLRALGNTLEEVKKEVAYRKNSARDNGAYENIKLKNYTLDKLIGAETMWNEV